jgi:hypothetical protein
VVEEHSAVAVLYFNEQLILMLVFGKLTRATVTFAGL